MKKFSKCSAICFVVVCWVVLSIVGYLGKDTVYRQYSLDVKKTPYFVLVLEGIHDGIYPWSRKTTSLWEKWEQVAKEKKENEAGESVLSTEETDGQEQEAGEGIPDGVEQENNSENVMSEGMESTGDTNESGNTNQGKDEKEKKQKEFQKIEEDYFSDAIFIGDSRTVGLHDYGGLDDAMFYATVGMNVYDLWEKAHCEIDGRKMTLEEVLSEKTFGKVYFQIGINEMGRGTVDGFMEAYSQSVKRFRELQPDAVIFVQGIMKVAKNKSEKDEIFNNLGIEERNQRIAALADGTDIFYLDMNQVVCDEDGNLRSDLTFDDVHLYGSKYDEWVQFLMEHGIE